MPFFISVRLPSNSHAESGMIWVFWASTALILYTYAGYLLLLFLWSKIRSRDVSPAPVFPPVSVVIAARNEAKNLPAKLANLAALDYPQDKIEIIVVSDGSSDETEQFLSTATRVRPIFLKGGGKALALNEGVGAASHSIVVFTDARQSLEPESLRAMIRNFADPTIGCVSGELMLRDPEDPHSVGGIGLYWKIEKMVRSLESKTSSVVGVTGAFYAARRELLIPIPANTILDDVFTPMHIAKAGARVIFEPGARAWDVPVAAAAVEFRRKVRTLTGNYQLVRLAPWVLLFKNPLWFQFVSHKLLRLAVPFALIALFISSFFLHGMFYRAVLILQSAFYCAGLLALAGLKPWRRLADFALGFLVLNAAAFIAFFNFLGGKTDVWQRPEAIQ